MVYLKKPHTLNGIDILQTLTTTKKCSQKQYLSWIQHFHNLKQAE